MNEIRDAIERARAAQPPDFRPDAPEPPQEESLLDEPEPPEGECEK